MNIKGTKKKNQAVTVNIFEQQEIISKAETIKESLKASTWRELETNGKFDKNVKLTFISDDMLILGCDVGSETHYARAIDPRGRELSRSAFAFSNSLEGFQSMKEQAVQIAAANNKKQIVMGLEPTDHYWFCLATWMISNGISVVQVNPYAVKQTKEIEDNSQLKDDTKDPKLIANLVISGIGENTLSGILAEIGDISRFDDVKEIQKLSGLGLVGCSSGKHKGETKISHRGRKRLRYGLFQAAKSAVAHAEEFKELHIYYTTRRENPLKKIQSLIAIACKLLRVIYAILTKGIVYDPKKMLMDIRRPAKQETIAE